MSPAARTHDPATSHAAARSITGVSLTQDRILSIVRDASLFGGGITDEGIRATYQKRAKVRAWPMPSEERIRTARKELADRGDLRICVDDDGVPILRLTSRKRWSRTWTVTS